MSNQNNSKSEQVAQVFKKITNSIIGLQKSNPKVFYGGAVLLLIFFLFTFVGSGTEDSSQMSMHLVNGQNYVMKNPNGGDVLLTIRPIFGSAGSGEDSNVCLVKPDTDVKVVEQTMANYITYVKVEPQGGDCQGKSGWTSKVNIKQ
ncbi:MAG: hypothetical protein L0Y38_06975 [Methylococcaceae bacterium]|nr:hypothetical protein [Methylococcaceae bacterium]MCI0667758.1 hypothetical protein [Methylococcaceae bacterium]MCI0733549.1 hypothetical protein [Methylococcaceae bacterium]